KPKTGLLTEYFSEAYDLANSFVIGDRLTDVELAKNLGSKGIYINDNTHLGNNEITVQRKDLDPYIALDSNEWEEIYELLTLDQRVAEPRRTNNETDIFIKLNLHGTKKGNISNGLEFFDHMLDKLARHGLI